MKLQDRTTLWLRYKADSYEGNCQEVGHGHIGCKSHPNKANLKTECLKPDDPTAELWLLAPTEHTNSKAFQDLWLKKQLNFRPFPRKATPQHLYNHNTQSPLKFQDFRRAAKGAKLMTLSAAVPFASHHWFCSLFVMHPKHSIGLQRYVSKGLVSFPFPLKTQVFHPSVI